MKQQIFIATTNGKINVPGHPLIFEWNNYKFAACQSWSSWRDENQFDPQWKQVVHVETGLQIVSSANMFNETLLQAKQRAIESLDRFGLERFEKELNSWRSKHETNHKSTSN